MTVLTLALFAAGGGCEQCHVKEAAGQANSPMAHALERAAECEILAGHAVLQFRDGRYSYTIRREGKRSMYTVTDGTDSIAVPISWAFGLGAAGQTYVFERDGRMYESRVSFYKGIDGLDLTMGAANAAPATLEEAAGRRMDARDARDCFNCHATSAASGPALVPGVQCARCHAGAEQHMAAVRAGDAAHAAMTRLATLSTEEMSDFCGACHRTWAQIAAAGPRGVLNVRFQPYRLAGSRCYDASDRRIACTACHQPHGHSAADRASYDTKCLACHVKAKPCPAAARNCVSCHMPGIELPGAHFTFTDHRIRVVKAGSPYPD